MDEIDIWRAADQMMKLHGKDATIHAALRADKMLELGDHHGFQTWKRIAAAIAKLERKQLQANEFMN